MKILIAPDKFKGSLTSPQAAQAIAAGIRRALPHATLDLCPVADGGEGTVHALASAAPNAQLLTTPVTGPLPQTTVQATYALLPSSPATGTSQLATAVLEMSSAAGLALLPPEKRNPLNTTTYGVGQLVLHALNNGARRIILGIGGSATNDGGVGCAQAAGAKVWIDTNPKSRSRFNIEEALPTLLHDPFTGRDLPTFHSILRPTLPPDTQILVACDVTNPLFGPTGAAQTYAPQKGATPDQIEFLDQGLQHLATRTRNPQLASTPGAGAAGGLGFGLLAFLSAQLKPGIELITEALHVKDRLHNCDLCITGEGNIDPQSLSGKTPVGIARLCRQASVPCLALAGSLTNLSPSDLQSAGISNAYQLNPALPLEQRLSNAATLLSDLAEQAIREWAKH